MPGGLDHIAHAVRDLDAAAGFYQRAGSTVGARNRRAWGTHNTIVQFPEVFIEPIRFVVRDKAAAMAALKSSGIAAAERDGQVVVPPDAAHGATLIFEPTK
jgi:catechol 2,3-dioxygenase-like lactoylglutathione lyase family enzyme